MRHAEQRAPQRTRSYQSGQSARRASSAEILATNTMMLYFQALGRGTQVLEQTSVGEGAACWESLLERSLTAFGPVQQQ